MGWEGQMMGGKEGKDRQGLKTIKTGRVTAELMLCTIVLYEDNGAEM